MGNIPYTPAMSDRAYKLASEYSKWESLSGLTLIPVRRTSSKLDHISGMLGAQVVNKQGEEGVMLKGKDIKFDINPFPAQWKTTGKDKIAFVVDDHEPMENAASGAKKGKNLEGLARLYGKKVIEIMDEEYAKEVKRRYEQICKTEAKQPFSESESMNRQTTKVYQNLQKAKNEKLKTETVEPLNKEVSELKEKLRKYEGVVKELKENQGEDVAKLKKEKEEAENRAYNNQKSYQKTQANLNTEKRKSKSKANQDEAPNKEQVEAL
ncbi:MAG: hypothetical protein ACOC4Y_02215 [bacterium]